MIKYTREWDRDGVPTETRRVEIDPPEIELPEWRVVVFSIGLAGSLGSFLVGMCLWIASEGWPPWRT